MDPLSFLTWRFYYFFRDPVRRPPPGRNVLAPADGRVLYVTDVARGEVPRPVKRGVPVPLDEWMGAPPVEGEGTLVGIYMTPLSVHFNRAPVPGRVTRVVPRPAQGENRSMARALMRLAWGMLPFDEAADYVLQNARNTIVIDGPVPVVLVQIADRYVHAIDCFVQPGEEVAAGAKVGLIRMGSQCDLFIPRRAGVALTCRPGDRVVAGETVLGTY
ncbi:MAG TPA: phosphatidylserine decarboxylase [Polyangia bacterium]|jgi:phosphatidylserine decarboxylase